MKRMERMHEPRTLGVRQESLSQRTPKVQLQWQLPLLAHPPNPPHAISPSVLDASGASQRRQELRAWIRGGAGAPGMLR